MKKVTLGFAATLASGWLGAFAQDAATIATPNGRIAYDFVDMWFNQHQAAKAWDTYVARTGFENHAVYNSTTKSLHNSFDQEKAEEARAAGPGTVFDIKQVVAQGNLVFLHIAASHGQGGVGPATGNPPPNATPAAAQNGPGPAGDGKGPDEMVMILRIKNGKVVDHWDLHVPTNSDSVVFADLDR
jgi:predicted SnoaL-like aldol condensation-catalyzing enzyme